MLTIVGQICSDVAALLVLDPYNLFLGFAILGCVMSILIRWFKSARFPL